jgi:hypothetical protein
LQYPGIADPLPRNSIVIIRNAIADVIVVMVIAGGYCLHPQAESCINRDGDGVATGHGEDGPAIKLAWI